MFLKCLDQFLRYHNNYYDNAKTVIFLYQMYLTKKKQTNLRKYGKVQFLEK